MSESAYGGESAPAWYRNGNGVFEDDVPLRRTYESSAPIIVKDRVTRAKTEKNATPVPVIENKTRVIRGPEPEEQAKQEEQQDSMYDIGELRKQVMTELYNEFFADIKKEVREELLKEKPAIVREITGELREKLKSDLRKSFIQGEGEGR